MIGERPEPPCCVKLAGLVPLSSEDLIWSQEFLLRLRAETNY